MNSLLPTPPPAPRGVRYARTGEYRRCAGVDCGAIKPARAFARPTHGYFHFCDTCRGEPHESPAEKRAAQRAAAREAKLAARRETRGERRFWLRQLRKRAEGGA